MRRTAVLTALVVSGLASAQTYPVINFETVDAGGSEADTLIQPLSQVCGILTITGYDGGIDGGSFWFEVLPVDPLNPSVPIGLGADAGPFSTAVSGVSACYNTLDGGSPGVLAKWTVTGANPYFTGVTLSVANTQAVLPGPAGPQGAPGSGGTNDAGCLVLSNGSQFCSWPDASYPSVNLIMSADGGDLQVSGLGNGLFASFGQDANPDFAGLFVGDVAVQKRTLGNYAIISSPSDLSNDTWVNVDDGGAVGFRIGDANRFVCNQFGCFMAATGGADVIGLDIGELMSFSESGKDAGYIGVLSNVDQMTMGSWAFGSGPTGSFCFWDPTLVNIESATNFSLCMFGDAGITALNADNELRMQIAGTTVVDVKPGNTTINGNLDLDAGCLTLGGVVYCSLQDAGFGGGGTPGPCDAGGTCNPLDVNGGLTVGGNATLVDGGCFVLPNGSTFCQWPPDGGSPVGAAFYPSDGGVFRISNGGGGNPDGGPLFLEIQQDADPSFMGIFVGDVAVPARTRTNYALIASPSDQTNDTWLNTESGGTVGFRIHDNSTFVCNDAAGTANCGFGSVGLPHGKLYVGGFSDSYDWLAVQSSDLIVNAASTYIQQIAGVNEEQLTSTSKTIYLPLLIWSPAVYNSLELQGSSTGVAPSILGNCTDTDCNVHIDGQGAGHPTSVAWCGGGSTTPPIGCYVPAPSSSSDTIVNAPSGQCIDFDIGGTGTFHICSDGGFPVGGGGSSPGYPSDGGVCLVNTAGATACPLSPGSWDIEAVDSGFTRIGASGQLATEIESFAFDGGEVAHVDTLGNFAGNACCSLGNDGCYTPAPSGVSDSKMDAPSGQCDDMTVNGVIKASFCAASSSFTSPTIAGCSTYSSGATVCPLSPGAVDLKAVDGGATEIEASDNTNTAIVKFLFDGGVESYVTPLGGYCASSGCAASFSNSSGNALVNGSSGVVLQANGVNEVDISSSSISNYLPTLVWSSAVFNAVEIQGGATGVAPSVAADCSDTDCNLHLAGQGAGSVTSVSYCGGGSTTPPIGCFTPAASSSADTTIDAPTSHCVDVTLNAGGTTSAQFCGSVDYITAALQVGTSAAAGTSTDTGTWLGFGTHALDLGSAPTITASSEAACLGTLTSKSIAGGDGAGIASFTTGTTSPCAADTALFTVTLHDSYSSAGYVIMVSDADGTAGILSTSAYYAIPTSSSVFTIHNVSAITPAESTAYKLQFMTMGAGATH